MVHATLNLTYSKEYIGQYIVNILYNIIISESSISFYVMCDHVTVTVT